MADPQSTSCRESVVRLAMLAQPMRVLRTTLRTLHVLAIAAFYGGHVFSVAPDRLMPALAAVLVSGFLFMLFEISREPVWVHQLRGVGTLLKLMLLGLIAVFWEQRVLILSLIVVIGVLISHAPGRFRYYSVLYRRVVESHGKG